MRILFQGDSITDAFRSRENPRELGLGYVKYVADALRAIEGKEDLDCLNLGIGGDQTEQLLARLQSDFLDIKPDIITILVGINDTWHWGEKGQFLDDSFFESNYEKLLQAIRKELDCKIIILEPFLLDLDNMRYLKKDLNAKIEVIRRLARKYADEYIPLDGIFAKLSLEKEPSYWAEDGVHPSDAGHRVMADHLFEVLAPYVKGEK